MKNLITFLILLFFSFNLVQAQEENYFDEILKEKIPNKEVREYLRTIKEKSDKNLDYVDEINAIKTLFENLNQSQANDKILTDNNFGEGAEPFVAINPNNPDNIAVSFMIQNEVSLTMPIYISMDAGDTWTQSDFDTNEIITDLLSATGLGGGDPVLVFDPNGRLHITWLVAYLSGFNVNMSLFYAYSDDGGATITIPPLDQHMLYEANILNNQAIDRQWMATDFSGGDNTDNLYISALYLGTTLSQSGEIVIIKNTVNIEDDYEVTLVVPFSGPEATQFGNVKVDGNGNVHLACVLFDQNTQVGNIMYSKSIDGGQTFETTELSEFSTTLPSGGSIPSLVHSRENSATSLAVNGNDVYISWTDMSNQTIKSYYIYSNNSGTDWSAPIEFGPAQVDGENYHLMPNVSASDDRMSIAWYVVNSETLMADYWYAESQDGGETLINPQIISDGTTDFNGESTSSNFFGDYNTTDSNGCMTYTIWSDGNTGSPHVYITAIDGCAVGIAETTIIGGTFSVQSLYPNPVSTELKLLVNSQQNDQLEMVIYTLEGKDVLNRFKINVNQGDNELVFSNIDLASGSYLLKISNQEAQYITRLITVD